MAICPVRRQCPRFQATGYSRSRAVHDQGPRGYPVSEVEPMTLRSVLVSTDGPFTLSLLAFTVTLSLGRPHGSCREARPCRDEITIYPRTESHTCSGDQDHRKGGRRRGEKEREVKEEMRYWEAKNCLITHLMPIKSYKCLKKLL